MRKIELLVPASSLEVLKTAVIFGADAVYIGGEAFGLRAKAKNFSMEDMKEGIAFAHAHDVKVYVTANILAHNYDLEGARAYFEELKTTFVIFSFPQLLFPVFAAFPVPSFTVLTNSLFISSAVCLEIICSGLSS